MKKEEIVPKIKASLKKIGEFRLTKFLLSKKEKKLLNQVEIKEELIEFYQSKINSMQEAIKEFEQGIIDEETAIKSLKADIGKIQKVIEL